MASPLYSGERRSVHNPGINPGDHVRTAIRNMIPFGPKDVEFIETGKARYYVYGKMTFQDVDGNSHEGHFCRLYDPQVHALIVCAEHNDMN